jgi:hypothetical protein
MPTTLYLRRDESAPSGLTLPSGYQGAWDFTYAPDAGAGAKALDSSPGAAQSGAIPSWGSQGLTTKGYGHAQFLSSPLSAQTISAGNWTVAFAALLNNANASFTWAPFVGIYLMNGATGAVRSTIFALAQLTGSAAGRSGTGELTGYSTTCSGSSVVASSGDYIAVEIGISVHNVGGASVPNTEAFSSGTVAISSDNVAASNAQSFVTATGVLSFLAPIPIVQTTQHRTAAGHKPKMPPIGRKVQPGQGKFARIPRIGQTASPVARRAKRVDQPPTPLIPKLHGKAKYHRPISTGQVGNPIMQRHKRVDQAPRPPVRPQKVKRTPSSFHTAQVLTITIVKSRRVVNVRKNPPPRPAKVRKTKKASTQAVVLHVRGRRARGAARRSTGGQLSRGNSTRRGQQPLLRSGVQTQIQRRRKVFRPTRYAKPPTGGKSKHWIVAKNPAAVAGTRRVIPRQFPAPKFAISKRRTNRRRPIWTESIHRQRSRVARFMLHVALLSPALLTLARPHRVNRNVLKVVAIATGRRRFDRQRVPAFRLAKRVTHARYFVVPLLVPAKRSRVLQGIRHGLPLPRVRFRTHHPHRQFTYKVSGRKTVLNFDPLPARPSQTKHRKLPSTNMPWTVKRRTTGEQRVRPPVVRGRHKVFRVPGSGKMAIPVAKRAKFMDAPRPSVLMVRGRHIRRFVRYVPVLAPSGVSVAGPYYVAAAQIYCAGAAQGDVTTE